ncbi:acyloxyacyl hydrolase [Rhizobium sp. Nf11,1]|uniref:acyloxyacyl hydrolase n=1 Tax=Rhizobium sp. Nf11,1 TaxID=3404923 RepID=UPI003D332A00
MRVEFGKIALRFLGLASVAAVAVTSMAGSANAGEQIFDELRFGASASVQSGRAGEDGVFPEITALFDPFGYEEAVGWQQQLLHPRVHLGTSIGTSGEATQFFTGFTWTVDLNAKLFAEAGFGGVIHTGELDDNDDGPELGCRVLFHEYVGAGYRLTRNWNVMAQIAHSSHADLCDGPNDGMTRAGIQIGYKF